MRILRCLLLLPFDASTRPLRDVISRVLRQNRIEPVTLDRELAAGAQWVRGIKDLMQTTDLVIADLSRRNPNVAFELGLAEGMGKPFIPIIDEKAGESPLPSVLAGYQFIEYTPENLSRFNKRLDRAIRSFVAREEQPL